MKDETYGVAASMDGHGLLRLLGNFLGRAATESKEGGA